MAITVVLIPCFGAGAQFFDGSGVPLAYGFLYSFLAGTTTAEDTWTSHTGSVLNPNPIVLDSEGRVPEEIWGNLAKKYKFRLEDHLHSEIWTKDYIYHYITPVVPPPTPEDQVPEITTVWQFMTDEQIADVKARTFLLDCTEAIQTGIDYVRQQLATTSKPLGELYIPAGGYRIEDTLIVNGPITIIGAGEGSPNDPSTGLPNAVKPATDIKWYGSADVMMIFGANGSTPFAGGGGWGWALDGRQVATECLRVSDAIRFWFRNIAPANATQKVLSLQSSRAVAYPTGYGQFSDMWVSTGITGSNNAIALWVGSDAPATARNGVDGVTIITFTSCNFQSDQNAAVEITDRGDHFTWVHCTTGHAGGAGVPGTWFRGNYLGDYANTAIAMHTWVHHIGDFRFDKGLGIGHRIINLDTVDVSDAAFQNPRNALSGAGATEVACDNLTGFLWGQNKTLGYEESIRHDSMQFIAHSGSVLTTTQGSWKTALVGSGSVTDGATAGGSVLLTTGATINDQVAIFNTATVGSGGLNPFYYPNTVFSVAPISTATVIYRIGWMDTLSDPPTNGIYIEADSTVDTLWHFVCKTGSGTTKVDSKFVFDVADAIYRSRIELSNNPVAAANFYMTRPPFNLWGATTTTDVTTITTNVPDVTTDMSFVFQIITKGAAGKTMNACDFKLGFNTEVEIA